jgi:endoglucanase
MRMEVSPLVVYVDEPERTRRRSMRAPPSDGAHSPCPPPHNLRAEPWGLLGETLGTRWHRVCGRLGIMRGINLAGAFDGGRGGWLSERHFDAVQRAGFDTVRLPVRWSLGGEPPYRVDRACFDRVDRAVDAALRRHLDVVLDVHHFHELCADVERHRPAFLALWSQIAEHYATADRRLVFELLNEPHEPMAAEQWNELLAEALAVVRRSNPDRGVIAGPVLWNTVEGLPELRLPDDDRLIVTVHYYSPFPFTHQGAAWLPEAAGWRVPSWGTEAERAKVRDDLAFAAAWAQARGRPLFLGEFGTIENAPMTARATWTRHVRTEAERLGVPWAYWDFATDFGAFDAGRHAWREPLAQALLGDRH